MVLPDEDEALFLTMRDELWSALAPVGGLEEMLCERVVSATWRLRRVLSVEAEVFEERRSGPRDELRDPLFVAKGRGIGVAWLRAAPILEGLTRYEAHAERSLFRNLHELQRVQAERAGLPVAPPAVVELDVTMVAEPLPCGVGARAGGFVPQETEPPTETAGPTPAKE